MLCPAFSFSLNNPVQEKMAVVARIDGKTPSLVCVTIGGKVFIYTPKGQLDQDNNNTVKLEFLSLNKHIKSISSGKYNAEQPTDLLLMASENTLVAYDVLSNSELYNRDVSDGINVIAFGMMCGQSNQMAVVGGNCSLLGFSEQAEEVYWNVTSDTVSSIIFCDLDGDQRDELIVGTDDNIIRVFKNEEIIYEVTEAAKPVCLCAMTKSRFAFGLSNGMVGVYHKKSRKWRAKSQIAPVAIVYADFEKDQGYRPLVVARVNGQIELKHDTSGETIHKINLNKPISQMVREEFRMDGTKQIIAITEDGTVKGFTVSSQRDLSSDTSGTQSKIDMHEQIEELQKKKAMLLMKQQQLQDGIKGKSGEGQQNTSLAQQENYILPKDTKVNYIFQHSLKNRCLELIIYSSKNTYIKSAILFSEKLFTGEAFFYSPAKISHTIRIPLTIQHNFQEKIRVKAMVGTSAHANYYQVFDFETILPKFANYIILDQPQIEQQLKSNPPQSILTMKINERIPRFLKWIEQSFIVESKSIQSLEKQNNLDIKFANITNGLQFVLQVQTSSGIINILTDSIELAGDIVQDMCSYINVQELETTGQFPIEMNKFQQVLNKVDEYKATKMNITADIADSVNNAKMFIVKAEDARMIGDMKFMKKYYADVMGENKNLMTELIKRKQNNDILMESLREVNSMINKAANLRIGSFKTKVTNLCRNAIKENNLLSLIYIIENCRDLQ